MIDAKARRPARKVAGLVALGLAVIGIGSAAALAIRGEPRPIPAPAPAAVAEPESRAVLAEWARVAYQARCADCHGAEGRPDPVRVAFMSSHPSDLTAIRWGDADAPDRVRKAIVEGLPKRSMPPFGKVFDDRQVAAMIAHLRALAPGSTAPMPPGLASKLEAARFLPEPSLGPAPPIEMEAVDGARTTLAGASGKLTLVVFWGTACAPCLEEFPELERLADAYRGRGLAVLPVATNISDPDSIRVAVDGRITHLPVFFARTPDTMLDYDLRTVPAAALIDRAGRLLGIARSRTAWEKPAFLDLLEACLEPAPPA